MARQIRLTHVAQKQIGDAIDRLYDRAKARFLGPGAEKLYGKQLVFNFPTELSLTGLFNVATRQEGVAPNEDLLRGLLKIAGSYLDASREKTKARTLQRVQSFLTEAQSAGIVTDVPTVLGGQLADVWGEVSRDVRRIVETETTVARNTGIFDAIGRIAATTGVDDPTVFFVVVRDGSLCSECKRLHMMPDGVTPRLWKQSSLGGGYHKKGDPNPKVVGLHPHCRCVLSTLLPGYGFNAAGRVEYKKPGYDAYANQQG